MCISRQTVSHYEVIVSCDNAPEVAQYVRDHYPEFHVCESYYQGFGVALARNIAALQAKGRLLIFLDSDVVVPTHYIESYVGNYRENTLLIAKLDYYNESMTEVIESESRVGFQDPHIEIQRAARHWWTCNAAVDRKSFLSIGGFDMHFLGLGGSDSDFALRHAQMYQSVVYVDCLSKHQGMTSGKSKENKYCRKLYHSKRDAKWYQYYDLQNERSILKVFSELSSTQTF